ncbi:7TM GPCR protein, partial [Aphelenchoides avenae]
MAPCLPPLMGSFEYVSVTFGVVLNALLVYLVVYKTNRELRVYSKALLCNCVTDVSFAVVCLLVDFHMAIVDGNVFYIFTNGVAAGSTPINHFLFCLYMFGLSMNTMMGAVPFVYRYLLVCRNYTLSNVQYFGFIILAMALSSALPLVFVAVYFPASDRLAANLTLRCQTSGAFPYLHLEESDTVFKLFPIALGSAMIFVPYVVVLCCSRAIYITIKNAVMSSNSRHLQQQLTYALLAQ